MDTGTPVDAAGYDVAKNQIKDSITTSHNHDVAGNLIRLAGREYVWDGENRLKEVRVTNGATLGTYEYDGEGRRIRKTVVGGATTM